jgi:hypothetical protein
MLLFQLLAGIKGKNHSRDLGIAFRLLPFQNCSQNEANLKDVGENEVQILHHTTQHQFENN